MAGERADFSFRIPAQNFHLEILLSRNFGDDKYDKMSGFKNWNKCFSFLRAFKGLLIIYLFQCILSNQRNETEE